MSLLLALRVAPTLAASLGSWKGILWRTLGGSWCSTSALRRRIITWLRRRCSSSRLEAPRQSHCRRRPKYLQRRNGIRRGGRGGAWVRGASWGLHSLTEAPPGETICSTSSVLFLNSPTALLVWGNFCKRGYFCLMISSSRFSPPPPLPYQHHKKAPPATFTSHQPNVFFFFWFSFISLFISLFVYRTELALRTKPGDEPSWWKGENLTEHAQWATANQRSSLSHSRVQTERGRKQINSCKVASLFLRGKNKDIYTHTHTCTKRYTHKYIHIYKHTHIKNIWACSAQVFEFWDILPLQFRSFRQF